MTRKRDRVVMVVVLLVTAALCTAGIAALGWAQPKHGGVSTNASQSPATYTSLLGKDRAPESGVAVSVAVVIQRQVAVEVSTPGFLSPFEELTIAAEVSGSVESQWVEVADGVSKGQVLFQIGNELPTVALDKALAEAERAASDVHRAQENANRVEDLQATESVGPTEVLDVTTSLAKAKAMAKWADAAVAEARILLHKTTIVSPLNGVVARIHRWQGEYAHVGQPLVDIIAIDRLKLTVQLSDREVVAFAAGDPVSIAAPALPGEAFDGTILRIYPRATADSRKFEVEIEVPNSDRRLRPGFFVRAKLTANPRHPADAAPIPMILTIPRLGVMERYRRQHCYVVRRVEGESVERAFLTPVETLPLLSDPQSVQVVSGIALGDRVVTTGLQHVTHECVVRVVE